MGKASRDKGKRFERLWRDVLREYGYLKARRGQQHSGEIGNPDVVCPELPEILWEVKGGNGPSVYAALVQARFMAEKSACRVLPVVAIKRHLKSWYVAMEPKVTKEILHRSSAKTCLCIEVDQYGNLSVHDILARVQQPAFPRIPVVGLTRRGCPTIDVMDVPSFMAILKESDLVT
jgi:hypothetical protein